MTALRQKPGKSDWPSQPRLPVQHWHRGAGPARRLTALAFAIIVVAALAACAGYDEGECALRDLDSGEYWVRNPTTGAVESIRCPLSDREIARYSRTITAQRTQTARATRRAAAEAEQEQAKATAQADQRTRTRAEQQTRAAEAPTVAASLTRRADQRTATQTARQQQTRMARQRDAAQTKTAQQIADLVEQARQEAQCRWIRDNYNLTKQRSDADFRQFRQDHNAAILRCRVEETTPTPTLTPTP